MSDFKYLHNLYENEVDRNFNPAVNASDFKKDTVDIEIGEYVFTDEIINNIYQVLSAIRDQQTNHSGIWINGYFGSGKSHFMKFLDYCLLPEYNERALNRLKEAVKEHDPLQNPESKCDVTIADINALTDWYRKATVETILFNIGSVAKSNADKKHVFAEIFWHEFNRHRGYNTFSLPLAQYLEKALDERGKFEEFKHRLDEEYGWDWKEMAADLANTELDTILDVAKEIVPSLSTDVIRQRILKNDYPVSVENFMNELRSYISSKPEDYRLIFFADEISQFIDHRGSLLLELQQISSELNKFCDGKVWLACTAQQDLSEILGDCHIAKTTDDYGKIMGRFQVKVSLKGTNSEYITQKRILDKKAPAAMMLEERFGKIHSSITAQLQLPAGYNIYRTKEEFADYYPFVPYQFTLMMNIFDAFVDQNFVDKEVKGNERSIIKITHSVARDTMDQPIGDIISFDQFYNAMFRGSLTTKGQKSIATANKIIESYKENRELGERVLNVLFMICNMDEQQRRVFPATTDYVTTLLMRDVDTNKLKLKTDVQAVIDYLCNNNILRRETLADGHTETYTFFTEEERRVADSISNQYVDNDFVANLLIDFFKGYIAPQNRESYCSSKFTVGGIVNGKAFLTSNANVMVEFVLEYDGTIQDYLFQNVRNRLSFFMAGEGFEQLRDKLYWICKVQKYLQSPAGQSTSDARKAALDKFRQMAADQYKAIQKSLRALFNSAPVLSYNQQLAVPSSTKDKERYTEAITRHLQSLYPYAKLASDPSVPKTETELKEKIMRPAQKNEYTGLKEPLSTPENEIENHIKQRGGEANLKDIVKKFSEAPYGWSQEATIHFVNELVRRNVREFTYNNAENPDRRDVAANVIRDTSRFMVKGAKVIPQTVINDFLEAWHDIFGDASSPGSSHPTEIHNWARKILDTKISVDRDAIDRLGGSASPVAVWLTQSIEMLKEWLEIRDDEPFFRRISADREGAKKLMDRTKQVRQFVDNQNTLKAYGEFIKFVNENRDNWEYLSDSYQADVEGLKSILTEQWPIDKMRHYKKMVQTLSKALDDERQTLRKRIEEKLLAQDADIAAYADEKKVEYESNVRGAITRATISSNIATLRANELSNDWFSSEISHINAEVARRNSGSGTGGNGAGSDPTPPTPTTKVVKLRLQTPSLSNIRNAEDIEKYLERLRQQLTQKLANLNSGDEIQVL